MLLFRSDAQVCVLGGDEGGVEAMKSISVIIHICAFVPAILIQPEQVYLGFICPKNLIPEHGRHLGVFWQSGFPILEHQQCFASCCKPS